LKAVSFSLLLLVTVPVGAQTPGPTPGTAKTLSKPSSYLFSSNTVWGRLKVQVWTEPGKFKVEAVGDHPISGWSLLEEGTKRVLSRGAVQPTPILRFEISQAFQGPYRLTAFLLDGKEEVPVSIELSVEGAQDPTSRSGPVEAFKPDTDRPFNSMVRSLYEKASDQYARGSLKGAEKSLVKAEEMDPEQPQVRVFLERVRGELGVPASLSKMEVGTGSEERSMKKGSLFPPKRRAPKATPTPEPVESSIDRAAKADRAYNLGLESYRQSDLSAAKKFWEETLRIDPTHPQAKRNLERLKKEHPDLP
jgi:hypothetical protein